VLLLNRSPRGLAAGRLVLLAVDFAGRLGSLAIASGAVRPEFCCPALDEWPEPVSLVQVAFAEVSARTIAVMAGLRSRIWPGSQDTSQPPRSGR